jgi:flagellin FlaB
LIAFVVVASVFAFTVLSTGIFSAERGKETVFAGLEQARGSVELKGSVIANGVVDTTLSTADSAWSFDTTKTSVTRDATDKKEGSYSGEFTPTTSATGLIAYEAISPTLDLTNHDSVELWLKSSVAVNTAGDVQLRISDSTTCGTSGNYEDINLPVLAANAWKHVTVGISSGTTRSAVACVGLVIDSAYSTAPTINTDNILVRGQVTSVVVTVANSVEGEPVDLTAPSDSDDDGFADTSDTQQKVILSYSDASQLKNDLYWTKNFIGVNDSDDLLEEGERVELTVNLKALDQATPLTRNKDFTIEVKPSSGSVLAIQRTTPAKIDTVMNLQ